MAILAKCPICRRKQSIRNKKCKGCGEDLDKAKKSGRVEYWINYLLPNGKQRREPVGTSIEDARAADGKRKAQKKESNIFEIIDKKLTFNQLSKWYLSLEKVKALASYNTIKINLNKFNSVFGDMPVFKIRLSDLENYQSRRLKEGKAPATVDHEIGKAKTMIFKGFDDDLIGANTLKAFRRVKKTLKRGSDIRDRILSTDEFEALMKHSIGHTKALIATGYYTGMRKGEILKLTWDKVDFVNRMIQLDAEHTKDKEKRNIPICDELYNVLFSLPNGLQESNKDNHVFQYKGKSIEGDIRDSLKKACKDAAIKYGRFVDGGFIFHDLRHTFNTNMRKAGVAESVIMEITGHSTREMFDRYNTVDEDDTRKAINQLEVFFGKVDQFVDQNEKSNKKEIG